MSEEEQEMGFPEVGDTLTVAGDPDGIWSGPEGYRPGRTVTVREVETRPGHYYRPIPDIWVKSELCWVKVNEFSGCWFPRCFKEIKHLQK